MTWAVGQHVVVTSGPQDPDRHGVIKHVYTDGDVLVAGIGKDGLRFRRSGLAWGAGQLVMHDAARHASGRARTAAVAAVQERISGWPVERILALAAEIEARAPTFGTIALLSWDVRVDGDRQAIEPLDAARAREDYDNWRAHLAVVHHAECADADKHGEPRPKPPTLELVVEVVVDRWEP